MPELYVGACGGAGATRVTMVWGAPCASAPVGGREDPRPPLGEGFVCNVVSRNEDVWLHRGDSDGRVDPAVHVCTCCSSPEGGRNRGGCVCSSLPLLAVRSVCRRQSKGPWCPLGTVYAMEWDLNRENLRGFCFHFEFLAKTPFVPRGLEE